MNVHPAPAEVSHASSGHEDPEGLDRIRKFTGNYYRVLGWIAVVSTIISVATAYWTDSLHLDASFIFWFYLGSSLKKGIPAARKWAIVVFVLVSAFLAIGYIVPGFTVSFGAHVFEKSDLAFSGILVFFWIVFAIPAFVLLGSRGRAAFVGTKD
ncbi:MAG: hypothetical protein AAGA58_09240 [Verrucomicrobiota bacterium]